MELSSWQRFCYRVAGRWFPSARQDKDLSQRLQRANVLILPEVHKATTLITVVATVLICVGLTALLLAVAVPIYESVQTEQSKSECDGWAYWNGDKLDSSQPGDGCPYYATRELPLIGKIGAAAIGGLVLPAFIALLLNGDVDRRIRTRARKLEIYLPYAASYTAAMAAANATPVRIFRSLAESEEIYGEIAHDSAIIYRDVQVLGFDLVAAIKMAVERAASPWVSEFFQGIVGTLSSGGNLKMYFLNRAEFYMRENRIRLTVFLERLALLAESYVVVAVAMPLFFIVMLVIMFWVSGSGSSLSEEFLYVVVLGVLPLIHVFYSFGIFSMSQEQRM